MTKLEVWGDPIAHSKSPQLHSAAYTALGLDWAYSRRQVSKAEFGANITAIGDDFRGLSLTMPLKERAFALASVRDERSLATGSVNTLLFETDGVRGYNTDVGGFLGALKENGVEAVETARIIGAGATAASALVALVEAGAQSIEIIARSPEKAADLLASAEKLGVRASASPFDGADRSAQVDATIATLPGGTEIDQRGAIALADTGGVLLDAVYAPWPTQLSVAFSEAGKNASSGQLMLLHQAVLQVRIFVNGDVTRPLESEDVIMAAMRRALMGD